MTDRFSKEVRSRIMSGVRGKDTSPELILRKALSTRGLRYRKNYRMGRKAVDIAFVNKKVAVFVDGCFWHGCRLHGNRPKSNLRYWDAKIRANMRRDRITDSELQRGDWHVVRVWEHELKTDAERVSEHVSGILS